MYRTQRRFCECGATREAPAHLRVVSCVRCGRALMAAPEQVAPPPSAGIAAIAALASQLLGAAVFALVLGWAWTTRSDDRIVIAALLAIGAAWVFAGGSALRGSVAALGCCALLDVVLALLALIDVSITRGFVRTATAGLAPPLAARVDMVVAISGGVAALAAVACIAAVPSVRRLAAWQDARIARVG